LIGLGFSFSFEKQAEARVKVKEKTTYYRISGKTGAALNKSMLQGGGSRISLSHAVAATETELDFGEPKIVIKGNKCVVEDVDVFLNIKYIYPKWADRRGASVKTKKRWAAFWKELKRHERNHGEIAKAGAKALEKELKKMTGTVASGCSNFGAFAGFKLKTIIRKMGQAQKNFDRREYASSSKISKLQRLLYEAK